MTGTGGERRAAERRSRELISGKVSFIGDIGAAAAACATAENAVKAAQARARELVEQARREGEQFVAAARRQAVEADSEYAAAFGRAVDEGWAVDMLTALGYRPPTRPARRVTRASAERARAAAVMGSGSAVTGDRDGDGVAA